MMLGAEVAAIAAAKKNRSGNPPTNAGTQVGTPMASQKLWKRPAPPSAPAVPVPISSQRYKKKRDDIVPVAPEKKSEIRSALSAMLASRIPKNPNDKSPPVSQPPAVSNPQKILARNDIVPISADKKAQATNALAGMFASRAPPPHKSTGNPSTVHKSATSVPTNQLEMDPVVAISADKKTEASDALANMFASRTSKWPSPDEGLYGAPQNSHSSRVPSQRQQQVGPVSPSPKLQLTASQEQRERVMGFVMSPAKEQHPIPGDEEDSYSDLTPTLMTLTPNKKLSDPRPTSISPSKGRNHVVRAYSQKGSQSPRAVASPSARLKAKRAAAAAAAAASSPDGPQSQRATSMSARELLQENAGFTSRTTAEQATSMGARELMQQENPSVSTSSVKVKAQRTTGIVRDNTEQSAGTSPSAAVKAQRASSMTAAEAHKNYPVPGTRSQSMSINVQQENKASSTLASTRTQREGARTQNAPDGLVPNPTIKAQRTSMGTATEPADSSMSSQSTRPKKGKRAPYRPPDPLGTELPKPTATIITQSSKPEPSGGDAGTEAMVAPPASAKSEDSAVKNSQRPPSPFKRFFGRSMTPQLSAVDAGTERKSLFGRSVTPQPFATEAGKEKKSFFARSTTPQYSASASTEAGTDKKTANRGKKAWLGSFRGKAVTGKPEVSIGGSSEMGNASDLSTSVSHIDGRSDHARSEADVTTVAFKNFPDATAIPVDTNANDTYSPGFREFDRLDSETTGLKTQQGAASTGDSEDLRRLQVELQAAKTTASQLEGVNRNYRKTQKQMLKDLREAQIELEKYRDAKVNGPKSAESQRLAEELASTMAELIALREEHQALVTKHSGEGNLELAGRKTENGAFHQDETQLNLHKDLAQSMAVISQLEEENEMFRNQLSKMETVEQKLQQTQIERDAYIEKLRQQEVSNAGDTRRQAEMIMMQRLQKEKKQLAESEKSLTEKVEKLESKNKNQKAIFQTAMEIKEVEMKIIEKERGILARKVEEMESGRRAKDAALQDETKRLQLRLRKMQEEHEAQSKAFTDKILDLTKKLEAKNTDIERLENQLEAEQDKTKAQGDSVVVTHNTEMARLCEHILSKERELEDLKEFARLEVLKVRQDKEDEIITLRKQVEEQKSNLASKDGQIRKLNDQLAEAERELELFRSQSLRRSPVSESSSSERLAALRDRVGNYETLMRSKVASIRKMSPSSRDTTATTSAEPTLVVATPVHSENDDGDKYGVMEDSLRKSEARIAQLEEELAHTREELQETKWRGSATQPDNDEEDSDVVSTTAESIRGLVDSLKESDERVAALKNQLEEAKARLAKAESSLHTRRNSADSFATLESKRPSAFRVHSSHTLGSLDSADISYMDEFQSEDDIQPLLCVLAQKDDALSELKKQVSDLQKEKEAAEKLRHTTETELSDTKSRCETLELELSRASQQISPESTSKSNVSAQEEKTKSLEHQLALTANKLAEANSKIVMLEEFIHEERSVASRANKDNPVEIRVLKEHLREKDKEIERLRRVAEVSEEQLQRARSNVEGLELERKRSQAKLSQLLSLLEKRGTDETETQLAKKCIEVAEVSAEKDELIQKLRAANLAIGKLEAQLDDFDSGNPDPGGSNKLALKLTETELKLDELREKLVAAEETSRKLEEKNERLSKTVNGGPGAPEEFTTRMRFLEEQNAAYASTIKALRSEMATRHNGTFWGET